jgi:putative SOS response-associated peptidase YedK
MCGRAYETYSDEELAFRYHNEKIKKKPFAVPSGLRPNYNFAPTQNSPIVRLNDGEITIDLLKWGLVPFWAKDVKIGYKLINARSETISEKPSFREAFKKRRCIIPFSGFIEWKREGKIKRPFVIHLKDEPIMSVAGIWESWSPKDKDGNKVKGKELQTFSVVTVGPNSFMEQIHDRMPAILSRKDEEQWLDQDSEPESLQRILKSCPSKWMQAYEVSTLINKAENNSEEVLKPLTGEILEG